MSRKALKKRNLSGKGICDVCGAQEYLEEHHIQGRKIRNANMPFNLAYICPNCHLKVHVGEIIIEKWMTSTKGRVLIWHWKNEDSLTGDDATPHLI